VRIRSDHNFLENWSSHLHAKDAVPTLEHFLPLIYALGASFESRYGTPEVIYDEIQNGSISMRSFWFN
jgi:aromatic ring-opening dioxygenase catalytic subunit (LigB family)